MGLITHKVVFCCFHWWSAIVGHRECESLGANLSDVSSYSNVPRGLWLLITLPLPLTHLQPQQDRPTRKSLKIWRNWKPRLLKTITFDGPANKSSSSQKPGVFSRRNPLYLTTTKSFQFWLYLQPFQLLQWPAQSPYLNPMEIFWALLEQRLSQDTPRPRGVQELWENVCSTYRSYDAEDCEKLYKGMPRRISVVLKAKGYWTRYWSLKIFLNNIEYKT